MNSSLLIFGFGGHARSVANVALAAGFTQLLFVDSAARDGENFMGFAAVRELPRPLPPEVRGFVAIGDSTRRAVMVADLCNSVPLCTLIAPTAVIGVGSRIGEGTLVAHQAHVGPMAKVGDGVIINTGAIIEHECVIGDFSHVSVNATVAGRSRLGKHVMLGAGAIVIDAISICDRVVVGAGAVVVKDITEPGTYVGVPAKRVSC